MSDSQGPDETSPDGTAPDGTSATSSGAAEGTPKEIFDGEVVLPTDGPTSTGTVTPTGTTPPPTTGGYIPPQVSDPHYSESGVPTFDFVRDKIENRISTAIGSKELAEESAEGRSVDEKMRKRDEAAKKRLEEIRKSMGQ